MHMDTHIFIYIFIYIYIYIYGGIYFVSVKQNLTTVVPLKKGPRFINESINSLINQLID